LYGRIRRRGLSLVSRWLRNIFGRGETRSPEGPSALFGLDKAERERIGTEDDPLRGFEAAMERHAEAERAQRNAADSGRAIQLYELSVSEGFVGSHPYERLASLHERRRDYEAALKACEAYLRLAASGRMPKGAQRSADRKLPRFEARIEHYRRLLDRG
jgi:hypothetical protein